MAFYYCPYILKTGEVCNRDSFRPAGCQVHWDSPRSVSCKDCGAILSEEAREDGAKIRSAWRKYIASEYTDIVQSSVNSCQ
ncbi:hypothetical protein Glove_529g22 [Diversispora epigaea]|uniref:Uncharacterized protein n=1 Tax=Diversispora epigaea TaxID=1348612 RepID=A0A397GMC2_9GLOM|nr:hypothetical protein Glove_529g22 [Diversispora epigaea]